MQLLLNICIFQIVQHINISLTLTIHGYTHITIKNKYKKFQRIWSWIDWVMQTTAMKWFDGGAKKVPWDIFSQRVNPLTKRGLCISNTAVIASVDQARLAGENYEINYFLLLLLQWLRSYIFSFYHKTMFIHSLERALWGLSRRIQNVKIFPFPMEILPET